MPLSPGDAPPSPDSTRPSGFAGVFRGLTTARLTRSPPPVGPGASALVPPTLEPVNAVPSSVQGLSPSHMAALEHLRHGAPSERIAAAASLRHAVAEYPLSSVLDIWHAARDMIEPSKSNATRVAGWELLTECLKHSASSDLERQEYFQTLTSSSNPEDFHLQLAALVDLTKNGRVLSGFDYEVLPLLSTWLYKAFQDARQARREAARVSKAIGQARSGSSGEEKNLSQLFIFITEVIKSSFSVADDNAVCNLIDTLMMICMSTSVQDDLRACISVLNAIVTFGSLPSERLKKCVHVLSSIFCLVSSLHEDAWTTLSILCKSHNGQLTVRILLDILRTGSVEGVKDMDLNREIRGALCVIRELLSKSAEKGYPTVPFALLVDGLATTVKATSSVKAQHEILRLINLLFDAGDGALHPVAVEEDWTALLNVASECSKSATIPILQANLQTGPRGIQTSLSSSSLSSTSSKDEPEKPEESNGIEILRLITQLEALMLRGSSLVFIPRQTIVRFFSSVHTILPDSAANVVLDYFQEFRCCSPSDTEWEENLKLVVQAFFSNRSRSSTTRVRALNTITDAYEIMDLVHDGSHDFIPVLVRTILADVADEDDMQVLEAVVNLMGSIAVSADMELFNYIMDALKGVVLSERIKSPISPSSAQAQPPMTPTTPDQPDLKPGMSTANVVTRGYAKLFMRLMDADAAKSVELFNLLVNIAKAAQCKLDARLTAMKLLFRLRSDWANRVFLTVHLETDTLAAALYRTEESLKSKQESAPQPSRLSRGELGTGTVSRTTRGKSFSQPQPHEQGYPTRSASGAKPPVPGPKYQPMWWHPDPDALPEEASSSVSPVLVSYIDDATTQGENQGARQTQLDFASWLDALLQVTQQACDWEIYSFLIVHLPAQLSNHSVFRGAIKQVQEIRRVLCDVIRANSFQEPPLASGLRRTDVAICLYHSLIMILSYHRYFQKPEEDDIVRTFVHGMTWERTAKECIHALSICCHELPISTNKALVQVLHKMAQIITQPQVAMHVLEFLSGLCRMPHLYSDFREDEWRIVFGIAFRYLQYVRDKKQSHRNSVANGDVSAAATPGSDPAAAAAARSSSTDDLPQYVHALAYHVITYWFLALKLDERASHVGWIAKNLFTDIEDPQSEEQAVITMDFMRRVAYSDADDSAEDPLFTTDMFGKILKKSWVVGNSIITIKQATGSGWAQVTKRQPSGTSSYTVRETLQPRAPHHIGYSMAEGYAREGPLSTAAYGQTGNLYVLPSHLLVQMVSPIPQTVKAFKPVLLPDKEAVERAIRLFDMISTVDGHKIGVIYMGENQTDEVEILANVSGSTDYLEFLNGLGFLTKLKGATFNTQGLDKEHGVDGEYTFAWRDRVSEIVFHVTTQMPTNLERDPQCIYKKRHIGNDYVNIIFNDSGLPFEFNTFPSEFNFVNIVVTPESRTTFLARRERSNDSSTAHSPFYRVKVMSKPGFPRISPAGETKMVSLKALPGFVRQLAVNASVFSLVWANREGEHLSPWRARLRAIRKLRETYSRKSPAPSAASTPATGGAAGSAHHHIHHHHHHYHPGLSSVTSPSPPPATSALGGTPGSGHSNATTPGELSRPASTVRDSFASFRRSSVATFLTNTSDQPSHRSSVASTGTSDTETAATVSGGLDAVVDAVDFSRWA